MVQDSLKNQILRTFAQYPKNILIEDDHGSWTAEQLLAPIEKIQAQLESCSRPKGRIGVCFDNSGAQAIALLSILLADRVPVILNSVDILEGRVDWVRHSKLNFVLTSEDLTSHIQVPHLVLNNFGLPIQRIGKPNAVIELDQMLYAPPQGTAFILFTSGSTGEPKEVFIPECGVLETIQDLIGRFQLTATTVASITLPVCHSMALNTQFLPTLLVGGRCRFYNLRLSINKVYRGFLRDQSTFVALIGEIVRTCWEERRLKNLPTCDQVKHVQLAGGLISEKHLEMTQELFPKAILHKGYGLTEAIRVTMISNREEKFKTTAVGKPLSFLELKIRDEQGASVPTGVYGEICVRGASVMLGLRSLTSSHIQEFQRGDFLPTGDLGMLDEEGYLHVSGRLDSLFKINGRRVSGVEIEKVVLEACDQFRFAKTILVADEHRDRTRIVLFVELDRSCWTNGILSLDVSIQERLVQRMKTLSVPPKEIIFLRSIPRTSNGKLNLPRLRQIWRVYSVKPLEKAVVTNLNLFSVDEEVLA